MELAYPTILTVPLALGLLGFVEPCAIGAHLVFLNVVADRTRATKIAAIATFILVRTMVMGAIGAIAAVIGQQLIVVQSTLWLLFGVLYVAVGVAYATNRIAILKRRVGILPASWKAPNNPALLLGLAFGFSIPACAAPILVALFGLAAGSGAVLLGFMAMAVFALGLSVPLVALAWVGVPAWLRPSPQTVRWLLAAVFVAVGVWSIWFGLFVDATGWTL